MQKICFIPWDVLLQEFDENDRDETNFLSVLIDSVPLLLLSCPNGPLIPALVLTKFLRDFMATQSFYGIYMSPESKGASVG